MQMTELRKLRAVACAAALALPGAAGAYVEQDRTSVYQLGNGVFEVVGKNINSSHDYWCGAANYVRNTLGEPWNTPIYVSRGLGASTATDRPSAVQFTLDPNAVTGGGQGRLGLVKPGARKTVQSAIGSCYIPQRGN